MAPSAFSLLCSMAADCPGVQMEKHARSAHENWEQMAGQIGYICISK